MAATREAIDVIRGYFYQFDYYILQLLDLDDEKGNICLEGIEDVDIRLCDETTAVQCKYYAKTEYNHSVIAKPIRFMFQDFMQRVASGKFINYSLYGNYSSGQDKYPEKLDIDFLKLHFLTYTHDKKEHKLHEELCATDVQLQTFISRLKIDINAISYEEQVDKIIIKLQEVFKCDAFEAEFYYYNNALRIIKNIASEQDRKNRVYTRRRFLNEINLKNILFNDWFFELKGLNKYCKTIKQQYFTSSNVSPIERFFLVETDQTITDMEIVELVMKISEHWSRLSKRSIQPFCPYVYLHSISSKRLIDIKNILVKNGIKLIDGYDFFGADFSIKSLLKQANAYNEIKVKLINEIGIISNLIEQIHERKEIYEFFLDNPFFSVDSCVNRMIPIKTTKNVIDII